MGEGEELVEREIKWGGWGCVVALEDAGILIVMGRKDGYRYMC